MRGPTHVALGAVAFGATGAAALGLAPAEAATGMLAAGGAAMLPDLDTPGSGLARGFGPPGRAVAGAVGRLAGGHRGGTHSVVALVAVSLGAGLLFASAGTIAARVGALVLMALAARALLPGAHATVALAVAGALGVLVLPDARSLAWLGAAVAIGYATHLAADALTREGVALAWPVSARKVGLGVVRTGGTAEALACAGLTLALGALVWVRVLAPLLAG